MTQNPSSLINDVEGVANFFDDDVIADAGQFEQLDTPRLPERGQEVNLSELNANNPGVPLYAPDVDDNENASEVSNNEIINAVPKPIITSADLLGISRDNTVNKTKNKENSQQNVPAPPTPSSNQNTNVPVPRTPSSNQNVNAPPTPSRNQNTNVHVPRTPSGNQNVTAPSTPSRNQNTNVPVPRTPSSNQNVPAPPTQSNDPSYTNTIPLNFVTSILTSNRTPGRVGTPEYSEVNSNPPAPNTKNKDNDDLLNVNPNPRNTYAKKTPKNFAPIGYEDTSLEYSQSSNADNFNECINIILAHVSIITQTNYGGSLDNMAKDDLQQYLKKTIKHVASIFSQLSDYMLKDNDVLRELIQKLKTLLGNEFILVKFSDLLEKLKMKNWFFKLKNRILSENYIYNVCDILELINGIKAFIGFLYNVYYLYLYYTLNDINTLYKVTTEEIMQKSQSDNQTTITTTQRTTKIHKKSATGIKICDFVNRTVSKTDKLKVDTSIASPVTFKNVWQYTLEVFDSAVYTGHLIFDESESSYIKYLLLPKGDGLGLTVIYPPLPKINRSIVNKSGVNAIYNNYIDSYLLFPSYLFYQMISDEKKDVQKIVEKKLIELVYMYDEDLMRKNLERAKTTQKAQSPDIDADDDDNDSMEQNSNDATGESVEDDAEKDNVDEPPEINESRDDNTRDSEDDLEESSIRRPSSSAQFANTMDKSYERSEKEPSMPNEKKRKFQGEEQPPNKKLKSLQAKIFGKMKGKKKKTVSMNSFYLTSPEADYMEGTLNHFFTITCPGPKVVLKEMKVVDKISLNGKYMGFGTIFNDLEYISNGKYLLYNSTKFQNTLNREKLSSIYEDDIGYYIFSINSFIETSFSMKYLKLTNFNNLLILNIPNNTFPFNIHDIKRPFKKTVIMSHFDTLLEFNLNDTRKFSKINFYNVRPNLNFFDFLVKHASSELETVKIGRIGILGDTFNKCIINNPNNDKQFTNLKIHILGELRDFISDKAYPPEKYVSLIINFVHFNCKHDFCILGPRTAENTALENDLNEILPKFTKRYTFDTNNAVTHERIEYENSNSSSTQGSALSLNNIYVLNKKVLNNIVSFIDSNLKKVLCYSPNNKPIHELEIHVFQKHYNTIDKSLVPDTISVVYGETYEYESTFMKNFKPIQKFEIDELEIKNTRLTKPKAQEEEETVVVIPEVTVKSDSHEFFKSTETEDIKYETIYKLCQYEKLLFPVDSMLLPFNQITDGLINNTKTAKNELKKSKKKDANAENFFVLPKKDEDTKKFLTDFKKSLKTILPSRNILVGCKELVTNLLFGLSKSEKTKFPINRLTFMMILKYFSMEMLYDVFMNAKYELEGFTKTFLVSLVYARQFYLVLNIGKDVIEKLEEDVTIKSKSDFKNSEKYKNIPILLKYIDMFSNEFFNSYNKEYENMLISAPMEFVTTKRTELMNNYPRILKAVARGIEKDKFQTLNKNNIKSLLLPGLLEGTTPQLYGKKSNRNQKSDDFDPIYKFQDIDILGFGSGIILTAKDKKKFESISFYIQTGGSKTHKSKPFEYKSFIDAGIIPSTVKIQESNKAEIFKHLLPRFIMALQLILKLWEDEDALTNLKTVSNSKDLIKNPAGLESKYKKISFNMILDDPIQYITYFYGITLIKQIQTEKKKPKNKSDEESSEKSSKKKKSKTSKSTDSTKKSKKSEDSEDDMLTRRKKKSKNKSDDAHSQSDADNADSEQ